MVLNCQYILFLEKSQSKTEQSKSDRSPGSALTSTPKKDRSTDQKGSSQHDSGKQNKAGMKSDTRTKPSSVAESITKNIATKRATCSPPPPMKFLPSAEMPENQQVEVGGKFIVLLRAQVCSLLNTGY